MVVYLFVIYKSLGSVHSNHGKKLLKQFCLNLLEVVDKEFELQLLSLSLNIFSALCIEMQRKLHNNLLDVYVSNKCFLYLEYIH